MHLTVVFVIIKEVKEISETHKSLVSTSEMSVTATIHNAVEKWSICTYKLWVFPECYLDNTK